MQPTKPQRLSILGSTGSVGQSTLAVVALHPQRFSVVALTARQNVKQMLLQCQQFNPETVVMLDEQAAQRLITELRTIGLNHICVLSGAQSICDIAQQSDTDSIMSAIVGAAGLMPTLMAVKAGKRVLVANKEPLVMTGDLFMQEAKKSGATILPIDSEHTVSYTHLTLPTIYSV